MGYFLSQRSIDKVKSFLDDMVKSERSLEWKVDDATKAAYYIRQAIQAAAKLGLPEYATLVQRYKIKVVRNSVIAEVRGGLVGILSQRLILPGLSHLNEVVGAIAKHASRNEIEFPDVTLMNGEIQQLKVWLDTKSMESLPLERGILVRRK